jgi:hypothetical protein
MGTIQKQLANTVDTIADDGLRGRRARELRNTQSKKKVPIHLVLPPLMKKRGGEHPVVGPETAIVVEP